MLNNRVKAGVLTVRLTCCHNINVMEAAGKNQYVMEWNLNDLLFVAEDIISSFQIPGNLIETQI